MSVKPVVDAIVDEQLEAARLAEEVYKEGAKVGPQLVEAARRVLALRAAGKVSAGRAKALLRDAFVLLTLKAYAAHVGKVQQVVDEAMAAQKAALDAYGKPLSTVPAVRNADIKARDLERRGAVSKEGVVDGNGKA